jgi:hypothetical protein
VSMRVSSYSPEGKSPPFRLGYGQSGQTCPGGLRGGVPFLGAQGATVDKYIGDGVMVIFNTLRGGEDWQIEQFARSRATAG